MTQIFDNRETYFNKKVDKKVLQTLTASFFRSYGSIYTINFLESIKNLGFRYATHSGISLSIEDLKIPAEKNLLVQKTNIDVAQADFDFKRGYLTDVERFQKIIDLWDVTSDTLKNRIVDFFKIADPLNSIYMIAFSGARGNLSQVRQLIGMRGLMANQKGQVIDFPITKNFREGLTSVDYIISSYGARKGIVDTALRTADSGYLTRRLVEIGQYVIVRQVDCGTTRGVRIILSEYSKLKNVLEGRTLLSSLSLESGQAFPANTLLTLAICELLQNSTKYSVLIRSPLTCRSSNSICQHCYGSNLASQEFIELGEAIGVIAGQSIGEPGTQMTMRTFHTGGVFSGHFNELKKANIAGLIRFPSSVRGFVNRNSHGKYVLELDTDTQLSILDWKNDEHFVNLPRGAFLFVKENQFVKYNDPLAEIPSTGLSDSLGQPQFKGVLLPHDGELVFNNKEQTVKKLNSISVFLNQRDKMIWLLAGKCYLLNKQAHLCLKSDWLTLNTPFSKLNAVIPFSGKFNVSNNSTDLSSFEVKDYSIFESYAPLKIRWIKRKIKKDLKYKKELSLKFGGKNFYFYIRSNQRVFQREFLLKQVVPYKKQPKGKVGGSLTSSNLLLLSRIGPQTKNSIRNNILNLHPFAQNLGLVFPNKPWVFKVKNTVLASSNTMQMSFKLLFAGERLFNCISIGAPVYSLIIPFGNSSFSLVLLYPAFQFQLNQLIPNLSNYFKIDKKFFQVQLDPNFFWRKICRYHGSAVSSQKLIEDMFQNTIYLKSSYLDRKENFSLVTKEIKACLGDLLMLSNKKIKLKKEDYGVQKFDYPFLTISYFLSKNTRGDNLRTTFHSLTYPYQFVESYTRVGNILYFLLEQMNVSAFRSQISIRKKVVQNIVEVGKFVSAYQFFSMYEKIYSTKRILVVRDIDTTQLYSQKVKLVSHYVPKFTHLTKNIYLNQSAVIQSIKDNKILLRKATPMYLTVGAFLKQLDGHLVGQEELLAVLVNYSRQTDDIIQGLPKIESLFELRGRSNYAILAETSGIISNLWFNGDQNQHCVTIAGWKPWQYFESTTGDDEDIFTEYFLDVLNKEIVFLFNFIEFGEPLSDGLINPRELLRVYYNQISRVKGRLCALQICINKIQQLLVRSIQAIYKSQGIDIADKHIELVVKEMTSWVEILTSGDTPFLEGDTLNLHLMKDLHASLVKYKYHAPKYQPCLMGITNSTLNGKSFLSAASFQETRRVLAKSAIEGPIDWLESIKASVITGKLMPIGTGFTTYKSLYNYPNLSNITSFFGQRKVRRQSAKFSVDHSKNS